MIALMDRQEFFMRIGSFFILMASVFVVMFIVSDVAGKAIFDYFFIGILVGGLGVYIRRTAPTPEPSGRFETWKKWRSGRLKDEMASRREQKKAERLSIQEEKKAARAARAAERKERLRGSLRGLSKKNKDEE